jgi:hypothetical protein
LFCFIYKRGVVSVVVVVVVVIVVVVVASEVGSWIGSLFVCSSSPAAFVVRCCVVDLFAGVFAEEMSLRCGGGRGRLAFLNGL